MNGFIIISKSVGMPVYSEEVYPDFGLKIKNLNEFRLAGLLFTIQIQSSNLKKKIKSYKLQNYEIVFSENELYLCCIFIDNSIYKVEFEKDVGGIVHSCENLKGFNIAQFFAENILNEFTNKYKSAENINLVPKKSQFRSFKDNIFEIFKKIIVKILKSCFSFLNAYYKTNWIYMCYSPEFFSEMDQQNLSFCDEKNSLEDVKVFPYVKKKKKNFLKKFIQIFKNFVGKKSKERSIFQLLNEIQFYYEEKENKKFPQLSNNKNILNAIKLFFEGGNIMSFFNDTNQYFECILPKTNDKQMDLFKLVFFREDNLLIFFPVAYFDEDRDESILMKSVVKNSSEMYIKLLIEKNVQCLEVLLKNFWMYLKKLRFNK